MEPIFYIPLSLHIYSLICALIGVMLIHLSLHFGGKLAKPVAQSLARIGGIFLSLFVMVYLSATIAFPALTGRYFLYVFIIYLLVRLGWFLFKKYGSANKGAK